MSEPTEVSSAAGSTVPAGSVTSRYGGPPPNPFLIGLLGVDCAVIGAAAVAPIITRLQARLVNRFISLTSSPSSAMAVPGCHTIKAGLLAQPYCKNYSVKL